MRQSRRDLLAAAGGSVLLGGCSGLVGRRTDERTPGGTATGPRTASPTPVPVGGDWPTYQRDPGHTGRNPAATELASAPSPRWRVDCSGAAQPVVDGTRVYARGEDLVAAEGRDGSVAWRRSLDSAEGVALLDGRVLAPERGTLRAFDADGEQAWQVETGEAFLRAPTTDGERAYLWGGTTGQVSRDLYGLVSATFLAVDADGERAWERTFEEGVTFGFSLTFAAGDAVYLGGTRRLVALDAADGERRWRHWSRGHPGEGAVTEVRTPTLGDGTLYAGGRDGTSGVALAFDAATGERTWRTDLAEDPRGPLALADGRVLAGTRVGTVHCLDAATGEPQWTTRVAWDVAPAATVVGDAAYVGAGRRVAALELADGRERWSVELDARVTAAPVAVGDALLVATEAGVAAL